MDSFWGFDLDPKRFQLWIPLMIFGKCRVDHIFDMGPKIGIMVRESANVGFGWLVVIENLSWLKQSSTRSFEWRPKGISHSLYVPWSLWYFWLGPNPNLVSDPNWIWSRNQIRFGLGTKSDLVSEPNPIWSRNQIRFGLGPNSDLVSDPTRIWSRTQLRFGLGPKPILVKPNPIWS